MASDSTTLELLGLVADIYEMHTRKSIAHSQIEANQEEAEWELEHLQKINNQKRNTQLQQSLLIKEYDRNINELSNLEAKAKQYGLTFNDWEYLDDNDQTKEGKEILTKAGVSLGNDFDIRYENFTVDLSSPNLLDLPPARIVPRMLFSIIKRNINY